MGCLGSKNDDAIHENFIRYDEQVIIDMENMITALKFELETLQEAKARCVCGAYKENK